MFGGLQRALGLMCLLARHALAEAPTLEHIFPAGSERGSTNLVIVTGKLEPWPPKVWTDTRGINFLAETNKGKFRVEVAADAPPGPHLVRLYNDDGATEPRCFVVGEGREILDAEPNDYFSKPQIVSELPLTINGKLDKIGDVESFAVKMEAGQWIVAAVDAYALASKVDALLRVVDTRGLQLAWNHDFITFDPLLAWQAPNRDTYIVQVMGFAFPATSEVRLTGGDGCIYRLHLTTGPFVRYTVPSCIPRGKQTALQLFGWNLGQQGRQCEWPINPEGLPASASSALVKLTGMANEVAVPFSDIPEITEHEPNNSTNNAQQVELPIVVHACIETAGDEDRFNINAKKGEHIEAVLQSALLGFPLDAWLRIENAAGKELTRNDDTSSSHDPQLDWAAPADGTYVVAVGNLLKQGGSECIYRLTLKPAVPAFKVALGTSAFRVTAGKTNEIKLTVNRLYGFDHKLSAAIKDLPEAITCEPIEVPEKGGEIALKLIASEEAKPHNGLIRIVVSDTTSQHDRVVAAQLTSSSVDNGVPGGYTRLLIEKTEQLWLTVLPKATEEKKPEKE